MEVEFYLQSCFLGIFLLTLTIHVYMCSYTGKLYIIFFLYMQKYCFWWALNLIFLLYCLLMYCFSNFCQSLILSPLFSDVPFDTNASGKLLCVEWHIPFELCMKMSYDRKGHRRSLPIASCFRLHIWNWKWVLFGRLCWTLNCACCV